VAGAVVHEVVHVVARIGHQRPEFDAVDFVHAAAQRACVGLGPARAIPQNSAGVDTPRVALSGCDFVGEAAADTPLKRQPESGQTRSVPSIKYD